MDKIIDIFCLAAAVTTLEFVFKMVKAYLTIDAALIQKGYPKRQKIFIAPQYTIENYNSKMKRIDRLLKKLVFQRNGVKMILLLGDIGTGKTYLMTKLYRDLFFKTYIRNIGLEIINVDGIRDLRKIKSDCDHRGILLLDGLEKYYEFLHITNAEETKEIFYKIIEVMNGYSRIVIAMRSDFYFKNKENFEWISNRITHANGQKGIIITLERPTDISIQSYYRRRMKLDSREITKNLELINDSGGILGRPLFLPFVKFLPAKVQFANSYMIYDEIVKFWLDHEAKRCSILGNRIERKDIEEIFDRITIQYFSRVYSGKDIHFFHPEDIGYSEMIAKKVFFGACSVLQYDSRYGYYCTNNSFLEFNYVRLYYNRIYKMGVGQNKNNIRTMIRFFEERHYNNHFSQDFPETELVLYGGQKKVLADLRADEVNMVMRINILHSTDLRNKKFCDFLAGLFSPTFVMGRLIFSNAKFRLLVRNHILKICGERLQTVDDLEWFSYFPIYSLNASHMKINTLRFLNFFPQLEKLVAVGNPLNNLSSLNALVSCKSLKYLNLANCHLKSYMLSCNLPRSLQTLILSNNELSELSFLKFLQLNYLDISDNPLYDGIGNSLSLLNKWRCVYHFKSRQVKNLILSESTSKDIEICYNDIARFLKSNDYRVDVSEIQIDSLCGMENVYLKRIFLSMETVPLLTCLSRPLHTEAVTLNAPYEYKLGWALNKLSVVLNNFNRTGQHSPRLEYLYECCNDVFEYLVSAETDDDKASLKPNADIIKEMDTEIWTVCVNELILLAAFCLKQLGINNLQTGDTIINKRIYSFARARMNSNPPSPVIRFEVTVKSENMLFPGFERQNYKALRDLILKYSKPGKEFEEALEKIKVNTQKPVELLWHVRLNMDTRLMYT